MSSIVPFQKPSRHQGPTLARFAEDWFDQVSLGWRDSTIRRVRSIVDVHLIPVLETYPESGMTRRDVMALRADLSKGRGPSGKPCSNVRINSIMQVLNQMLVERQRQMDIPNPCLGVRSIPTRKPDIHPFTLPELRLLVEVAPERLKPYLWVRGILGLRSGEANGLMWDCVNFDTGTIEIKRSRSDGVDRLPKNQYSERIIRMTPSVLTSVRQAWEYTGGEGDYVFKSTRGKPLDIQNFARRDWKKILKKAELRYRAPEQLRHTGATLMLAAGEAPTYVAQVLGHADCRMLLTIYARYAPGALGRSDGAALETLLSA